MENHRHGFYLILRPKDQITHLTFTHLTLYDVVPVIIETPADSDFQRLLWLRRGCWDTRGVWVAQPQIKFKGISKKKRMIGEVEFRYFTEAGGRFMQLLPKKEGDELPTILH